MCNFHIIVHFNAHAPRRNIAFAMHLYQEYSVFELFENDSHKQEFKRSRILIIHFQPITKFPGPTHNYRIRNGKLIALGSVKGSNRFNRSKYESLETNY